MDHRNPSPRRHRLLGGLIAAGLLLTLPALAAGPAAPHRSPLAGVTALDRPVTYTETKIPLGELVAKVAADTGVNLTASAGVADEPVAVVVKGLPARELLEQLADWLDYQWHIQASRRSGVQAFRTGHSEGETTLVGPEHPDARTPERLNAQDHRCAAVPPERSPAFEIYQDVAGKQREEALRQAAFTAVERRLREQLGLAVELANLPAEQFQALLDAAEKHRQELAARSPSEQGAVQPSPRVQEQERRFQAARQLWSPANRGLARLLGRLSGAQWAALRQDGVLFFSTEPGLSGPPMPGEQPLPAAVERLFRLPLHDLFPPGALVQIPADAAEVQRRVEEETRAEWAQATGFKVTIRLNADQMLSRGELTLQASAVPFRTGEPFRSFSSLGATDLTFSATAGDPPLAGGAAESTPAAGRPVDPALSSPKRFHVTVKPRPSRFGAGTRPLRLQELLPDLAHTYGVPIVSDAYWVSSPLIPDLPPADAPVSLAALLDRFAGQTHVCNLAPAKGSGGGSLLRLRSRTWYFDRPREVPLRLIRRWKARGEQHGPLSLDECAEIAASLTDPQLDTLPTVAAEAGLPPHLIEAASLYRLRHELRLFASLPPGGQQALQRGEAIPVQAMTPAQRQLFLAAVKEHTYRADPPSIPDLSRWTAGSFSIGTERVVARSFGNGTTYVPAPRSAAGPSEVEASPGRSGAVEAMPLNDEGAKSGGEERAAAPPALAQVGFHLRFGPAADQHMIQFIRVALPS